LLDGEIGRRRNTGLIKWGYYMDHLLDYGFLCALLIGYFFILPTQFIYLHFFLLAVFGAYMANSFLAFAVTNKFQISYMGIGPTEIRLGFITTNILLATFGVTHLAFLTPYILGCSFVGLIITVYRTQRSIWKMDMDAKQP
jgi:archaetidylinositol phosphate synthase